MWEQVKSMTYEYLKEEVTEWVMDLGSIIGKLSAYDRIMETFWVMKGLIVGVFME